MSYEIRVQPSGSLVLVVFRGVISQDQEREALLDFAALPNVDPNARILVDRREATMTVTPKDVMPHLNLVRSSFKSTTGKPRLAIVAPTDLDFGMSRMLELAGGNDIPHHIMVVRTIEDGCEWLDVVPEDIVWP